MLRVDFPQSQWKIKTLYLELEPAAVDTVMHEAVAESKPELYIRDIKSQILPYIVNSKMFLKQWDQTGTSTLLARHSAFAGDAVDCGASDEQRAGPTN